MKSSLCRLCGQADTAGSRSSGDIAHHKLTAAVHKQFSDRDRMLAKARTVIEDYARKRVEAVMPMPTPTDLKVAKSAATVAALRQAIAEFQASHPNANRADVIDKILFSAPVTNLHKAEVGKLGINRNDGTLPQQRTADIDFGSPGVRGRTGYDRSVDGRPPGTPHASGGPQSGDDPKSTIDDHNEILEGIKSGKIPWNDPRVSAQVALERKRIFEND